MGLPGIATNVGRGTCYLGRKAQPLLNGRWSMSVVERKRDVRNREWSPTSNSNMNGKNPGQPWHQPDALNSGVGSRRVVLNRPAIATAQQQNYIWSSLAYFSVATARTLVARLAYHNLTDYTKRS